MASCDSSVEQEKKKHSRRRTSVSKGNPEVTYKPVYHRRRAPRVRHASKMHSVCKDPSDPVTDDGNDREGDISLSGKSKRHEHERSRKLSQDNYVEEKAFDVGDADSGIISSRIGNKHFSKDTLRIAKEYQKLQKSYKTVREECHKLSSAMERREAEYQRVCSHYETLVQMVQEMDETKVELIKRNQKLEAEKVQSNEDITLLKNIVYQLNAELERCQDKLRDRKSGSGSANSVENSGKEKAYGQRVWGSVSFHALAPLLNAYQENLSEKRELVIMYEQEMADFGSRCKAILTENELMHKEVEELRFECDRCAKEIKSVVENTTSLKKQNDSLQKESAVLRRDASEIRSTYELKIEAILSRNQVLKREHMTVTSELSNLKGKYEVLSKEFEKMKSKGEQSVPTSVHTSAIDECRTLLDELKYRYESEKRNLCNQIKRMEENQPENEKELVMVTAERNHLNTLIGRLERNLKYSSGARNVKPSIRRRYYIRLVFHVIL